MSATKIEAQFPGVKEIERQPSPLPEITLRDWFAAMALAGRTGSAEFAARDAYKIADDMMRLRNS